MPRGQEAPEPWAKAMRDVGAISDRTGLASMNELARMSGVHATTVQRIIYKRLGSRGVDADTIMKLATALEKKPKVIAEWVGQKWGSADGPYVAPKEADVLGPRVRKAFDELIRAVAEVQRQATERGEDADEDLGHMLGSGSR